MESSFYFDEKTQTWVDGSAPASGSNAAGTPSGAPPIAPMASTPAGVVARGLPAQAAGRHWNSPLEPGPPYPRIDIRSVVHQHQPSCISASADSPRPAGGLRLAFLDEARGSLDEQFRVRSVGRSVGRSVVRRSGGRRGRKRRGRRRCCGVGTPSRVAAPRGFNTDARLRFFAAPPQPPQGPLWPPPTCRWPRRWPCRWPCRLPSSCPH